MKETTWRGCLLGFAVSIAVLLSVGILYMMAKAALDDDWMQAIFWLLLFFGGGSRVDR